MTDREQYAAIGDEGPQWWKDAVIYQLYPRSFADSNGDGVGDLGGVLGKIDYLERLGVDALWLNPIFASPNRDYGYDVADYYAVDPQYGTIEEFDALLEELHRRDMRLVIDLAVNHTSDRHRWFLRSLSEPEGPYGDYYIWRPPRNGGLPNNWESFFGGPAWSFSPERGEYYLHLFSPHQPDLNWENPAVRAEVERIIRWWAGRGIDGIRLDVINMISKYPGLPDDNRKLDPLAVRGTIFFENGPRLHEYLAEIRHAAATPREPFLLGECPGSGLEEVLSLSGYERGELDAVFQMELMEIDHGEGGKWDVRPWQPEELASVVERWQRNLRGRAWPANFLGNHDQPRSVSRFGDPEHRRESATMLATLLLSLTGTPFIYYGEEIGMLNAEYGSIEEYRDVDTLNFFRLQREQGVEPETIMKTVKYMSRDNARSPMQWSAEPQAGFSSTVPWIPPAPNYREINAERELQAEDSIYHYYRRMIGLRKRAPALRRGAFRRIDTGDTRAFGFLKSRQGEEYLVLLNLSGSRVPAELSGELGGGWGEAVIGNYTDAQPSGGNREWKLRPYEAVICRRTGRRTGGT
jgi:oligo-1,6-glucosidase